MSTEIHFLCGGEVAQLKPAFRFGQHKSRFRIAELSSGFSHHFLCRIFLPFPEKHHTCGVSTEHLLSKSIHDIESHNNTSSYSSKPLNNYNRISARGTDPVSRCVPPEAKAATGSVPPEAKAATGSVPVAALSFHNLY